jgi:UDPglucose 6-dehydrogenase
MKIAVIGSGYVGLVSALGFCEMGHKVINFDISKKKIEYLQNGKLYIDEPGLDKIFKKNLNKNFFPVLEIEKCFNTDVIFIAINTPHTTRGINLEFLINSCKQIKKIISKKKIKKKVLLVVKSTVIPGTLENKIKPIFKNLKNVSLSNNPEFLREGSAVSDFIKSDRIVCGIENEFAKKKLKKVYYKFKKKIFFLNFNESELSKYFSNIFFSNLIAFTNEFSDLCNKVNNSDFIKILQTFISDRRIKYDIENKKKYPDLISYLVPGPGYGGSCFPKDTKSLLHFSKSKKLKLNILEGIIQNNNIRINSIQRKICSVLTKKNNLKFCFVGMGFKYGTSDLRESRSIDLANKLKNYKNGYF